MHLSNAIQLQVELYCGSLPRKRVGKHLHFEEVAFPLVVLVGGDAEVIGRLNFIPKRLNFSPGVVRTRRALRVRMEWVREVVGGKGATGISSSKLADLGKLLRVASRIPPALIFSAVANSRKSRPSSSTPRTNTGIDNGRRGCLRRSRSDFAMATRCLKGTQWAKPSALSKIESLVT